jgi:hypothetical protein
VYTATTGPCGSFHKLRGQDPAWTCVHTEDDTVIVAYTLHNFQDSHCLGHIVPHSSITTESAMVGMDLTSQAWFQFSSSGLFHHSWSVCQDFTETRHEILQQVSWLYLYCLPLSGIWHKIPSGQLWGKDVTLYKQPWGHRTFPLGKFRASTISAAQASKRSWGGHEALVGKQSVLSQGYPQNWASPLLPIPPKVSWQLMDHRSRKVLMLMVT